MTDLFFEILTEEIPASVQSLAKNHVKTFLADQLQSLRLDYRSIESEITPRRIVGHVQGLPSQQQHYTHEIKGPRVDAPELAIDGFCRTHDIERHQLTLQDTPKGQVYFYHQSHPGQPTTSLIPTMIQECIESFPWPKSMRWGDVTMPFIRPIQQIFVSWNGQCLEGQLDMGGGVILPYQKTTLGHRFDPTPFAVPSTYSEYIDTLRSHHVILSSDLRQTMIVEALDKLCHQYQCHWLRNDGLLSEIVGLVEWPTVLMGQIDASFLALPYEVLCTTLIQHQRYIPLLDHTGNITDFYAFVSNNPDPDCAPAVIHGNNRVLRARLNDAQFFWKHDQKTPLMNRVDALKNIIYHAKLGSIHDKIDRMQRAATGHMQKLLGAAQYHKDISTAIWLAKADLVTGMVGEFPELQGVMGSYYALIEGYSPDIAAAIRDHYSPKGQEDKAVFSADKPISLMVALCDKLDTLVQFFSIGEKPTGSKDPFALRRAALGVIKIIHQSLIRLPLRNAVEGFCVTKNNQDKRNDLIATDVVQFIMDRLGVYLRDLGYRYDLIKAVFGANSDDDILLIIKKMDAVREFSYMDRFGDFITVFKRASNIVDQAPEKQQIDQMVPRSDLFQYECEIKLDQKVQAIQHQTQQAHESFSDLMESIAGLRPLMDNFFEQVMVNDPDQSLRLNRLALLNQCRITVNHIADFSKLEG